MVKSYLTKQQAYEAPDTSVFTIRQELNFMDSTDKVALENMDYNEIFEDEDF